MNDNFVYLILTDSIVVNELTTRTFIQKNFGFYTRDVFLFSFNLFEFNFNIIKVE